MSHLLVYFCLCNSYGLIYNGVPTQESSIMDKLSTLLAKPKSANLKTPLFMSIFAGLRSR